MSDFSSHADHAIPNPHVPDSRRAVDQPVPTSPKTVIASGPISGPDPTANTRRCFVCLGDEHEATLPADWTTPCNCSLEGHHECLLAWVTDLEAQAKDVKCMVCKSPIIITERYDLAVQLGNFLNDGFSRWSPRVLLGLIATGALVSSAVYGIQAISWFAGPEAAIAFYTTDPKGASSRPSRRPAIKPRPFGILTLIAPALVINRLDVGDVITLPASLVYAALFNHSSESFIWPPSPNRVMAIYPAVKSTYFHLHRVVSDSLEKSWAAQARTMRVEHASQATHELVPPPEPAPAMNILDLEIDIQIGEAGHGLQNGGADGRGRSPINLIAGALLWPGVCYGVGELMRHVLPSRLVSKPLSGPTTGLLQERWGRSFIGGCLFVVLKDVFFLYVKYKRMMNRPHRRIKNSNRRNLRD